MSGVYVHVPFCAQRCGYCDFNTYIGGDHDAFVDAALREIAVMTVGAPETIFFGGGTPSILGAAPLARLLDAIGGSPAEVTVECNPEDASLAFFRNLRAAGATRISIGMQSAAPHVLRALERRHTPGRAVQAARQARAAGFEHVSLDLIAGARAESDEDWRTSVRAALAADPDHVSIYGLTVEAGTRLAAAVARDPRAAPDDDAIARRYALADELLADAGLRWYEVSSFAASDASRCRHNEGYWRSDDWWGVGPGAHSHVGGVRWWNVRRPAAYARRLAAGDSPAAGREELSARQRWLERVLLGIRRVEGLPVDGLPEAALAEQRALGRLEPREDRAVLTLRGRLFADAVTLALTLTRTA